jgi:hypothetical protein
MGFTSTTTKGRELSKVIQEKTYSFLSTGTLTYWPTDGIEIPDLLDFFVTSGISSTYTNIQSNYDLTSDHSPIIATLGTNACSQTINTSFAHLKKKLRYLETNNKRQSKSINKT